MAIELRSTGLSPGTSSTTCVITKPVGLATGDLMIAHVNSRVATNAHTAPDATWGAVTTQQATATRIVRSSLWRKIAT